MRQETDSGVAPVSGVVPPWAATVVPSLHLSKYVAGDKLEPFLT